MMGGMGIKRGWTTECDDFHIIACTGEGVGVYWAKGKYYEHTLSLPGPIMSSFSLPLILIFWWGPASVNRFANKPQV
jgi:hypothetical protein